MTKPRIFALLLAGVTLTVTIVKICKSIKNKKEESKPTATPESLHIGSDVPKVS